MELWRLRDAFHSGDLGEQLGEEAEFVEEFEATAGSALGEEVGGFFADAVRGHDVDFARVSADGGGRCRFDGVGETRSEADGAQHAEFVFGETAGWVADGADDSCGKISAAADEVEDFAGVVAHQQAVDSEIAALDIFFGGLRINNLIGMAAVGIADIGAEGGDFHLEGVVADEDDTELRADIEAVWEKLQNLLRSGVCGDVEIGGIATEKNVAHAAADEESLVPVTLTLVAHRVAGCPGVHGMIMRQKAGSDEAKK